MIKNCLVCNIEYMKKPFMSKTTWCKSKFCGIVCQNIHRSRTKRGINNASYKGKINKVCKTCNKEFEVYPYRKDALFCSIKCSKIDGVTKMKGETHWNWRGGITPEITAIRESAKYNEWRLSVLKRDNYTCQQCGNNKEKVEADHIKRFAFYPELRFDINNGQTLCKTCHKIKTVSENTGRKKTKKLLELMN